MSDLLVLARCAGFVSRAPGLSHPSVPPTVRAALALFFAMAVGPTAKPLAENVDGVAWLVAAVTEFLIGMGIGMAASLVYDGAYAGGRAVDDYVGVKAIAPNLQLVAPSGFGRVWSLAFTGGFFLTGAYRVMLLGFGRSFALLPPGAPIQTQVWSAYIAGFSTTLAQVALTVAGPAIGLAFVVQVAVAALSRAVPRFGSFTLAFPLAFAAALVMTAVGVPLLPRHNMQPFLAIPHLK